MAAIEFYRRVLAGNVSGQLEMPPVEVMGKHNSIIRVPCVGVSHIGIIDGKSGHKVKVIAERYTNENPHAMCAWIDLKPNEAVLGWRTDQATAAPGQWVVYLICDKAGKLIIIPRHSQPPAQKLAVVIGSI